MSKLCHKCGCSNMQCGEATGLYWIADEWWCWQCAGKEIKRLQKEVTEQSIRAEEAEEEGATLAGEVIELQRYPDAIAKLRLVQFTDQRICDDIVQMVKEAAEAEESEVAGVRKCPNCHHETLIRDPRVGPDYWYCSYSGCLGKKADEAGGT